MDQGTFDRALDFIRALIPDDPTGHGAFHARRVARTARFLAEREGADADVAELAALLHDADDPKLFPGNGENLKNACRFLAAEGISGELQDRICRIIRQVSFRGSDSVIPDTPEGRCVQDADRLDAIGAVGIARCFAYGGAKGRAIYDPSEPPAQDLDETQYRGRKSHSVNHFYEKLLLLKDMMTTRTGRELAEERHRFTQRFLEEFLAEWNGTR